LEKELEEMQELPVETLAPPEFAEQPDVAEDIVPQDNVDLSQLDVLNTSSPLILKGLYGGRVSYKTRRAALNRFAGKWGEATEAAVMNALRWLKEHQEYDGSWVDKKGSRKAAMTGLGLLTFLAHGETPASEEFGATVEKAIKWLLDNQGSDGLYCSGTSSGAGGKVSHDGPYEHAIATYAVSEAYALTRIPDLKPAMEKAVAHIIDGQQPGGGWDYFYRKAARRDTSIAGWSVQALKAAHIAGSDNEGVTNAMEKAVANLKQYQNSGGLFWYESPEKDANRTHDRLQYVTAIGSLALQLTGHAMDQETRRALSAIGSVDCNWDNGGEGQSGNSDRFFLYGWYYITQSKFHHGGSVWKSWNEKFAKALTENQEADGHWDAPLWHGQPEHRESGYGPVYCTTLAALTLQVYYRFLPTYQAKAVEAQEQSGEGAEEDVVVEF